MNVNKIRAFCQKFRIVLGSILIISGVLLLGKVSYAPWFFLGIIPLIAGLLNFCPLCIITKKCDIPQK
ncbi:MAG: DUF2892 domain-containing protein [Campylobacterales bacterium]|nr:DUF2892 domain-containing protein [Campylobacterales bacterium]